MRIKTTTNQEVILRATNGLCDFVKPTYGPANNKVIISKNGYLEALDDGVKIAKAYEAEDPSENAIVNFVKQVAIKTNDRVGDGTTGSLIMLQAIVNEMSKIKSKPKRLKLLNELKKAVEEAKKQIKAKTTPVDSLLELEQVARISYSDEKISKLIAGILYKLGEEGVLLVEESGTLETTSEVIDGFEFKSGILSPYMANSVKMEANVPKPYILLTDYRLTNATDVVPAIQMMMDNKKDGLVIIAEGIEGQAMATLLVNKIKNGLNIIGISIPAFTDKKNFIADLAIATGGQVISHENGTKMEDITMEMLGRADKIVSSEDKTIVIGGKAKKEDLSIAVNSLQEKINDLNILTSKREEFAKRLGMLNGKIAVIKVGAPTQHEMTAVKEKVEDAVNAVKSAYKGGVARGAGLTLSSLKTSSQTLNNALKYPHAQLMENLGLEEQELKEDEATNVVTGKKGNYLEVGVVDPAEVLIAQVESAVSIASLLLANVGIIYETNENTQDKA